MATDSNSSPQPYEGDGPYVFICYSHADTRVADEIRWLQEGGTNVWYDSGISPGSEWSETLAQKIRGCSHFLYFVSPNSVESEHCRRELSFAQNASKHIVAVQLETFDLPDGVLLSLGNRQIIHISELSERDYHSKLSAALHHGEDFVQPTRNGRRKPTVIWWPKWVALITVVLVAGVAASLFFSGRQKASQTAGEDTRPPVPLDPGVTSAETQKPSIAILPFLNMSGDSGQDSFVDGITVEIITRMSLNPLLTVIASSSTFYYKERQFKIQQVGRELGVQYVVEGSVRKRNGSIRVAAQLIDAETEGLLWTNTYSREMSDIFSLQDGIAQEIVASLNVTTLDSEEARRAYAPTEDLTAYEAFLKGAAYAYRYGVLEQERGSEARDLFEAAIELDPTFAEAYVGLGYTYFWADYVYGIELVTEPAEQAMRLARKAIDLNDTYYKAHSLMADYYNSQGESRKAITEAERAVSLNRNSADAYDTLGYVLLSAGRFEDSIAAINKAIQLNPRKLFNSLANLAAAYRKSGQHEKAIEVAEQAIVRNPEWVFPYATLALVSMELWFTQQTDDIRVLDRALNMAKKVTTLAKGTEYGQLLLIHTYAWRKQQDRAIQEAKALIASFPEVSTGYAWMALLLLYAQSPDEADAMIMKALERNPMDPIALLASANIHRFRGQYEEAIAQTRSYQQVYPAFESSYLAHTMRAILYGELGQIDEAQAEAAQIKKLIPAFSVDTWCERYIYGDRSWAERDKVALRKAGLR